MKRYWLFAGQDYYPNGGMDDFKGDRDDLEDLKTYIKKMEACEWAHIYDSFLLKIILEAHDVSTSYSEYIYEWRQRE